MSRTLRFFPGREMVTGRLPFAGQNMTMYLERVCNVSSAVHLLFQISSEPDRQSLGPVCCNAEQAFVTNT